MTRSAHRASSLRTRWSIALLTLAAVTAGSVHPITGDAAVTDRSTVAGNRVASNPAPDNPYGLYDAKVAPFIGMSFSDRAKGALSFTTREVLSALPPTPYPRFNTGEKITIWAELTSGIRFTEDFGFCDPSTHSTALKRMISITCDTTEHPNGTATAAITLVSLRDSNSTGSLLWGTLGTFSVGVIAPDGQTPGAHSARMSISYPDDADWIRKLTGSAHFSTVTGRATDMDVRAVSTVKDHGSTLWYSREKGHIRIDTGLEDSSSHGVTMKTGESFTYSLSFLRFTQGNFTLDPAPDPSLRDNVCARVVAGYTIECRTSGAGGEWVEVVTTRTGPDIANDKPLGGTIRIPIHSTYAGNGGASDSARVSLTAKMQHFGSRVLTGSGGLQDHAGVDHARVYQPTATADAGDAFSTGNEGELSFALFDPDADARPLGYSLYYGAGNTLIGRIRVPVEMELMTEPAPVGAARNWCDGQPWTGDMANALQTPVCTSAVDTTGSTPTRVITVTAAAATATGYTVLRNEYLPDTFSIRVRHGDTTGVNPTITATLQAVTGTGVHAWESEQSGNYPIAGPPAGLGVHNLTVAPYVGEAFSTNGEGKVSFDFFSGNAPAGSIVQGGDTLTATLDLGTSFEPSLDESLPEQGTGARNWCDGFDDWNSDLQGFLGTPDCNVTQDPTTGAFTAAVTVRALQDIPNDRLEDGFTVRVRAWHTLTDADQRITGTLTSSRPDVVDPRAATAQTTTPTTDRPSSSLGVWSAEAQDNNGDSPWPAGTEGHITWYADPHFATGPVLPLNIKRGDTITYGVTLPSGLTYRETSTTGAENICTEPNRYAGFAATCRITSDGITYVLTRTGPDDDAAAIDDSKQFSFPVVNTTTGSSSRGNVVISVSTTIRQSGSDHVRAVVPVDLSAEPSALTAPSKLAATTRAPATPDADPRRRKDIAHA